MSYLGTEYVTTHPRHDSSTPCDSCGAVPTAAVTIMSGAGAASRVSGPLCRNCGLSLFRDFTAHLLATGWFRFNSLLRTPIMLIGNQAARRELRRLGAPAEPTDGRSSLAPGRPLWRRWQSIGALVPLLVIAVIAGAFIAHGQVQRREVNARVGHCVSMNMAALIPSGSIVACAKPHNGRIVSVVGGGSDQSCPGTQMLVAMDNPQAQYCVSIDGR